MGAGVADLAGLEAAVDSWESYTRGHRPRPVVRDPQLQELPERAEQREQKRGDENFARNKPSAGAELLGGQHEDAGPDTECDW